MMAILLATGLPFAQGVPCRQVIKVRHLGLIVMTAMEAPILVQQPALEAIVVTGVMTMTAMA